MYKALKILYSSSFSQLVENWYINIYMYYK